MDIGFLAVLAVVVWVLQTVLGFYQFKRFNNHLKNLRKEGRVAIGRASGRFSAGVFILFVIDSNCKILKGEIMKGRTVFAGFKPFEKFNGLIKIQIYSKIFERKKFSDEKIFLGVFLFLVKIFF